MYIITTFSGRKFDVVWCLRKYFAKIEKVLRKFRKQNLCWRRVWLIRQLSKTDSDIREMDSNQNFRCSGWTVHLVHNHAWVWSQQMISGQWDVWQITRLLLNFSPPGPSFFEYNEMEGNAKDLGRTGGQVGVDWVWLIKEPRAPARQKAINGSFPSLTATSDMCSSFADGSQGLMSSNPAFL